MKQPQSEEAFLQRIRTSLEHSADELDSATVIRLGAVRHRALGQIRQPVRRPVIIAGGLLATAASVVLLVSVWLFQQPPQVQPPAYIEDIGLLSAREDIEFFEELDFYQWVANEQQAG